VRAVEDRICQDEFGIVRERIIVDGLLQINGYECVLVLSPRKCLTSLSQEALVEVKCRWKRGCLAS